MDNRIDDPQLIGELIENQDLLLSCAFNDQSQNELPYGCFSFNNNNCNTISLNENVNPLSFLSECKIQEQEQQKIDAEIKQEIIDFNILDLLQNEDPEMANLLETVNNNEYTNEQPALPVQYLPQISVNSTARILDNAIMPMNNETQLDLNFKLNKNSDDQFSEICDLLSINKNNELVLKKENEKFLPPTPPLTPPSSQTQSNSIPSRTSQRLAKKNTTTKSFSEDMFKPSSNMLNKMDKKSKRKRSVDEDDDDDSDRLLSTGNDDSVDSDNAFSSDLSCNMSENSYDGMNTNENSNDREFKEYVRRFQQENNLNLRRGRNGNQAGPVKKESNKEAATKYRMRKLSEKNQLFETRMHLEKENDQVKKKIDVVQTEINYLKTLLVQMIISKNSGSAGFKL